MRTVVGHTPAFFGRNWLVNHLNPDHSNSNYSIVGDSNSVGRLALRMHLMKGVQEVVAGVAGMN